MSYTFHLVVFIGIYSIVALSLNLLVGYAGRLTLAHAAFFGIGAYTYALLRVCRGWDFGGGLIGAVVVTALLSYLIGIPSVRLRGDVFVILSLAVEGMVFSLIYGWGSLRAPLGTWNNLTNGALGIAGIPGPSIRNYVVDSPDRFSLVTCVMAVGFILVVSRLLRSPWGRMLRAIRDDAVAAAGLGKSLISADTESFLIASSIAGIAGALYAAYMRFVDPSIAGFDNSLLLLAMVLVGGASPWLGPILGATVLVLIPELLRFAHIPGPHAANVQLVLYGISLVVMMHRRTRGLAGSERTVG